ncbi:hypothetical protein HN858_01920 [Candidatus Falkowbacteria bacterium]|jgi:hypothetical protein|nr:hypothetical protein [Candidatus Falkowbacteria bacterium]MBT6573604.1 hypothetical protein [Candidatus Falkowbacteria bacterium]MBT7348412.1 hypothetical protein [Candidatus Falkowbacteria bacterium]MBT7500634.1 hypothetical protein [Candidatus Falkowbacteria bacterium]
MVDGKKKIKDMTDEELLEFSQMVLTRSESFNKKDEKRVAANATQSLAACAILRERRALRLEKEKGMEADKNYHMNPPF